MQETDQDLQSLRILSQPEIYEHLSSDAGTGLINRFVYS